MSEKQVIENKLVGFHWKLSINREVRIATVVSKTYPDKTIYDAEFSGNTDTLEQAKTQIAEAKKELDKLTSLPIVETDKVPPEEEPPNI